jgi:hypothetical protein
MWGDNTAKQRAYGKGTILSGMTIEEALATIGVAPDVKLDAADMVYAHRTASGKEIYFIANRSEKPVQIAPEFRVAGKQPELWNPVSGEMRPLPAFEQKEASTIIPMQLESYESAFVVFAGAGKPQATGVKANFPDPETVVEITSPWTVTFESDTIKRGPAEPVTFSSLQSWSQNDDARIRYFSGAAVYTNTFTLDTTSAGKLYIDLGKVSVMAKVKINGQYAGGAWTPPYRVNITGAVKAGENNIEVEVVNTWINRFIGESFLPAEQRLVNHRLDHWKPTSALHESGLLGPVRVMR